MSEHDIKDREENAQLHRVIEKLVPLINEDYMRNIMDEAVRSSDKRVLHCVACPLRFGSAATRLRCIMQVVIRLESYFADKDDDLGGLKSLLTIAAQYAIDFKALDVRQKGFFDDNPNKE